MANWFSQMFTPQRQGPGQMVWQDIVNEQSGEFSTGDMQEQVWKPSVVGSNYVAGPTTRRKPAQPMQNPQSQEGTGLSAKQDFMAGMDRLRDQTFDDDPSADVTSPGWQAEGGSASTSPTIASTVLPSFAQTNTITEGPRSNYIPPEGMGGEFPSVFEGQGTNLDFNPEAGFNPIKASGSVMDSLIDYNKRAPQNNPREALPSVSDGFGESRAQDYMGGQQTQPTVIAQLMKLLGSGAGDMFSKMFSPSQAGAGMQGPTVPNLNPPGPGARFAGPMLDRPGTFGGSRRMY